MQHINIHVSIEQTGIDIEIEKSVANLSQNIKKIVKNNSKFEKKKNYYKYKNVDIPLNLNGF